MLLRKTGSTFELINVNKMSTEIARESWREIPFEKTELGIYLNFEQQRRMVVPSVKHGCVACWCTPHRPSFSIVRERARDHKEWTEIWSDAHRRLLVTRFSFTFCSGSFRINKGIPCTQLPCILYLFLMNSSILLCCSHICTHSLCRKDFKKIG